MTAVSVVAVHTLTFTAILDVTPLEKLTQYGFLTAFHFTREIFMFITSLALVYVYAGKPLDAGRFWKRRAVGVLIPYVAWSLIYQLIATRSTSPVAFVGTLLFNLLTGSASFQLYYILLTLEYYILFPWFLGILPHLAKRPWLTLSVSFALEIVMLFAIDRGMPLLHAPANVSVNLSLFFDRFAPLYQLYFVMGGLAALYLPQIKAFLTRSGAWMTLPGAVGLLILEGHYLDETLRVGDAPSASIAVLQPAMAPYSVGAIAFLYWMALWFSRRASQRHATRSTRIWRTLSDTAFGVYLVHPLFLTNMLLYVVPLIKNWPIALVVTMVWAVTAGASIGLTLLLLRIPVVSRLLGRERPSPEWLCAGWERTGAAIGRLAPDSWALGGARREKEVVGETELPARL
jgi:peptidoglycan/LPS O-acetylase OafA/YrhL